MLFLIRESKRSYSLSKPTNQSNKKQNNSVNTADLHNKQQSSPASTNSDNVTATDKIDYKTTLYARR